MFVSSAVRNFGCKKFKQEISFRKTRKVRIFHMLSGSDHHPECFGFQVVFLLRISVNFGHLGYLSLSLVSGVGIFYAFMAI